MKIKWLLNGDVSLNNKGNGYTRLFDLTKFLKPVMSLNHTKSLVDIHVSLWSA